MILREKVTLIGSRGQAEVVALFDSGATYSVVKGELARKLEVLVPLPTPKKLKLADGRTVEVRFRVSLDFKLNGVTLSDEFLVLDELADELIIGVKTMQAWRIKLDFEKEKVIVNPEVAKLLLL